MIFQKNRSLEILVTTFVFLTTFEYRNVTTHAIRILNVSHAHNMQPRSLIFPPTAPTRVQFIGGIGIPVEDLHFESVTSGYVLKAEYFLPERADEFRHKIKPQTIHRRRKSIYDIPPEIQYNIYSNETSKVPQKQQAMPSDNSKNQQKYGPVYRWIVYKAIEMIINNSGLDGHSCMLRSICEHAAIPLNYESGLLAEILHIILTPSTSKDDIRKPTHKDYLKAEVFGQSGENCALTFRECKKSLMELVSAVFEQ